MDLPRAFLRYDNFDLAFTRVVRGGNKEYKQFHRHLFPSYYLALRENLLDLIEDLKRGTYEPERPIVVYQPKKSGVLRPLTLLSLKDIIVYQAIVNRIAVAFESEQQKFAFKRSFGAIFAGRSSLFFYRSWKTSYRKYNEAMVSAFEAGRDFIADFDLVSFYELIDHGLLSEMLAKRVKSPSLLRLLVECLRMFSEHRLDPRHTRKSGRAQLPRRAPEGLMKRHAVLLDQDGGQCHRLHEILLGFRRLLGAMSTGVELVPNHPRHLRQLDGNAVSAREHGRPAAALEQIVVEWNCLRMPFEFRYRDNFTEHPAGSENVDAQTFGARQLHRRRRFVAWHAGDSGKRQLSRLHAG